MRVNSVFDELELVTKMTISSKTHKEKNQTRTKKHDAKMKTMNQKNHTRNPETLEGICSFGLGASQWSSWWQARVHQKRSSLASSMMFSMLEVMPVLIRGRVLTIFLWDFYHLLLIDISFKIVLALVTIFPTNLVSSNSESVCKSCGSFGVLKRLQRYYRELERM